MNVPDCDCLRLHFRKDIMAAFSFLFQKGFFAEITSSSLLDTLCRTCGFNPLQVHERIQTLFLNGKPVDDIPGTRIQDGDCIALSAAMPGLVGATMRSGGVLAGFRDSISHRAQPGRDSNGGLLSIKVFNLLIGEVGPGLLRQGILVPVEDLRSALASLTRRQWHDCAEAQLNSRTVEPEGLAAMAWADESPFVRLQVTFG
jgi:hypothetical protein